MNEWLAAWLHTGHAIDLILGIVALEVAALAWWLRRRGHRLTFAELAGPVIAGVFLMFAVRAALVGAEPHWVALFLMLSFPAHLYDLVLRFGRLSQRT